MSQPKDDRADGDIYGAHVLRQVPARGIVRYEGSGGLHYFLGIKVIRTPKGILISQRHYVLSMLFKFGIMECKSVSAPLDRNVKLSIKSGTTHDPKWFGQIVGSLIYLTINRPNLSYHVRFHQLVHVTNDRQTPLARTEYSGMSTILRIGRWYIKPVLPNG